VGTFLFLFVALGAAITAETSDAGLIRVALATGLALAVLILTIAPVSGAHFNPTVTFGVWLLGNIDGRRAMAYVLVQCMGAILAAAVLFAAVVGTAIDSRAPKLGAPLIGLAVAAPADACLSSGVRLRLQPGRLAHLLDGRELLRELAAHGRELLVGEVQLLGDLVEFRALLGRDGALGRADRERAAEQ